MELDNKFRDKYMKKIDFNSEGLTRKEKNRNTIFNSRMFRPMRNYLSKQNYFQSDDFRLKRHKLSKKVAINDELIHAQ